MEERASDSTRPADALDVVRLLVFGPTGARGIPLVHGQRLTIGRGADADVVVEDDRVSRVHVRVQVGPPMTVVDLGSKNGTRVRGLRIDPEIAVPIEPGDLVELGATALVVQGPTQGGLAPLSDLHSEPSGGSTPKREGTAMAQVERLIERVAGSSLHVLLLGETGVGKEVCARRIHEQSPRAADPFVAVNCASLSEALLDSELFGHDKGAFTSAAHGKPGLFELAGSGTVFLDEIGELSPQLQPKLLRALEERTARRVGGVREYKIEARFLAATNLDLVASVRAGTFRSDLYFRLAGLVIRIPPLRERKDELEPLARRFIDDASARAGRSAPSLADDVRTWMRSYDWPGNLRELKNLMERAALLADGPQVRLADLPDDALAAVTSAPPASAPASAEHQRILDALEHCGGNQTRAAELLGIPRRTLVRRLDELGVRRPKKR